MMFLVRTHCADMAIKKKKKKLLTESNDNSFSPECWDISAVEYILYGIKLSTFSSLPILPNGFDKKQVKKEK